MQPYGRIGRPQTSFWWCGACSDSLGFECAWRTTHNRADVLVVCQRFETGYDNDAVCVLGVDRQMSSEEPPARSVHSAGDQCGGDTLGALQVALEPPRQVARAALLQVELQILMQVAYAARMRQKRRPRRAMKIAAGYRGQLYRGQLG